MNQFKDFGIKPETNALEGEKIKINKVFNVPITVEAFKITPSKFEKGTGTCLQIQIRIEQQQRVVFTGSASLIDQIQKVPVNKFPFQTTIVRQNNDRFDFT